jgi:hypothetical protein
MGITNIQPEGNQTPATGAQETSQSSAASAGAAQPLPDYVTALQGQIAELSTLVKGVQKGTDKQIGQVRGDIKRILELKDSGMSEAQIQRELQLDALLGQSQNAPAQQSAGSGQTSTGLDVDSVISSLQFQPNDPALAALRLLHGNNPQELLKAAAGLRLSQLQTPNPSPATAPSQSGGQGSGGVNLDALSAEYEELAKNPAANFQRMTEIQQEFNKIK